MIRWYSELIWKYNDFTKLAKMGKLKVASWFHIFICRQWFSNHSSLFEAIFVFWVLCVFIYTMKMKRRNSSKSLHNKFRLIIRKFKSLWKGNQALWNSTNIIISIIIERTRTMPKQSYAQYNLNCLILPLDLRVSII